jgi:hypothetical protein
MRYSRIALLFLILLPFFLPQNSTAAGSTVPVFMIDATNPSNFSTTGSTLNSAVSESANAMSGSATTVSLETSAPTPAFYFNGSGYMIFANNVKPDVTNGASIQIVAKFNNTYTGGSWPRVIDFGETSGWGANHDNFSIQLGSTGSIEVYVSKLGVANSFFCGSAANSVVLDTFAIKVGSGVCSISVNGSAVSASSNEGSYPFAARVPSTSSTWSSRIATMVTGLQSPLTGRIRTVIFSSGTTSSNSVVFMPNGGTGFTASQVGTGSITLNANQYTRAGMSFTGWNTKSDGTGTAYAGGATYNLSSESNMLFAQWAVVPPALTLPTFTTATYRTPYTINLAINTAGTYTFFESGKRIAGCINLVGTPSTVTCSWKPAKIGAYSVSVQGKISGTTYSSNSAVVQVKARSNTR